MSNSTPWPIVVAAALIAGVAGGAVGRYVGPAPKRAAGATSAAAESPDAPEPGPAGLAQRVDQLEQNVARLERERRMARLASPWASAGPSDEDGGGARVPAVDDPVFQAAVRDIVDQAEEERRGDREVRSEERRKQIADRWSARLGDKLGLTDAQKQKVAEIVMDHLQQMRAARDSDAGPFSREEWRERARELRQKSEAKLGQVLDPTQRQKYDALDDDEKLGFGMGGRRRGGGP